jgi:DNA-binding XRE family transcriptional regulator
MLRLSPLAARHDPMSTTPTARNDSPIGIDHHAAHDRRMANPEYARAAATLAPLEALARVFIRYRIENGMTQEQLAAAMNTSPSAISRLESGQHQPNLETLRRFAHLSGRNLLVGFEDEGGHLELITV